MLCEFYCEKKNEGREEGRLSAGLWNPFESCISVRLLG